MIIPDSIDIDGESWPVRVVVISHSAYTDLIFHEIIINRVIAEYGSQDLIGYILAHEIKHAKINRIDAHLQMWNDIQELSTRPFWVSKEMHFCANQYHKKAGNLQMVQQLNYNIWMWVMPWLLLPVRAGYLCSQRRIAKNQGASP